MNAKAHVIDVTDQDFMERVVEESRRRPVLVDFWAPWCGPCRMLGPVLEKLAAEADGAWLLAKLNTDENPQVATQLQVSGIPDVKLFKDGRIADGFVGALPERQVRAFLERLVPGPADAALAEATRQLAMGDIAAATTYYERALAMKDDWAPALFALAKLAHAGGDVAKAAALLERIEPSEGARLGPAYGQLKLALGAGALDDLKRKVAANLADDDLAVEYGRALAAAGDHPGGLAVLLSVVKKLGRNGAGDRARAAMVEVFGALGVDSDVANEWRGKLAAELYK